MTDERRAELDRRAFPDGGVLRWRARMNVTFLGAVVLANVGQRPAAFGLLATAVPTAVRYVRRELALGALIAAERAELRERARIPASDMRAVRGRR